MTRREAQALNYLTKAGSVSIETATRDFWCCLLSLKIKGLVRFDGSVARPA